MARLFTQLSLNWRCFSLLFSFENGESRLRRNCLRLVKPDVRLEKSTNIAPRCVRYVRINATTCRERNNILYTFTAFLIPRAAISSHTRGTNYSSDSIMTARVLVSEHNLRLRFWFLGGRHRLGIIKYEESVTLWHYIDRKVCERLLIRGRFMRNAGDTVTYKAFANAMIQQWNYQNDQFIIFITYLTHVEQCIFFLEI